MGTALRVAICAGADSRLEFAASMNQNTEITMQVRRVGSRSCAPLNCGSIYLLPVTQFKNVTLRGIMEQNKM